MNVAQMLGRARVQLSHGNKVVGWEMTPEEAQVFFKSLGKTVVTLFGYSSAYEDERAALETMEKDLLKYSPDTALINIGATKGGLGAAYPLAKSMGFVTTGIVSTVALEIPDQISDSVDHICFIKDTQWGGNLPDSNMLSPTSRAMILCSEILISIGGGEITRDELLYGRQLGKPIYFHPAEVNHDHLARRMQRKGLPPPDSFMGEAYEVFGREE